MGQSHSGLQLGKRVGELSSHTPSRRVHRRKTIFKAMKYHSPHHEPAPACSSTLDTSDQISPESVLLTNENKLIHIPSEHIKKLGDFPHFEGGLVDIWKCSMSTPRGTRIVAVKTFGISESDDIEVFRKTVKRIRREACIWILLSHSHILPFEGFIEGFGPFPALVSVWMENGSLSDYLKWEYVNLSDVRKSELIQHVAAGLSYLHENDVVHGDLTGSNVLVDDSGNLRIADFSLSMILAQADNAIFNSVSPGISRWIAPEFIMLGFNERPGEVLHAKPTKEGDIYSFGCVMLQILSGEVPYSRMKSAMQVITAILRGWEPFDVAGINMNGAYTLLSSRCLSKEPHSRPTMVEIIQVVDLTV